MDKKKVGTMMQSAAKVPISELNECITCKLCRGYFIDATTIIECLHTFCRSCIVRYLETNKYCPICDVQVHKTKPLLNIRQDKTIQNLVYKLVPRLYQNEVQKRKAYYEVHPESKPSLFEESTATEFEYILAPEESVNVTLKYFGSDSTPRYLRCPSAVSVNHLKKLIRSKYELTDHNRVDVFYNQDCLNPSFSLMDILYIYSRKTKDPLELTYKIYECRAKKPKLDSAKNCANNSTNNNNNNWKEVQLRISENGEMSITGIEDANMMALLDATESYKSDIVMNEGKNLDVGLVESETSPANVKPDKSACTVEEKSIGKTSMSSCTTSTSHSIKTPISSTKTSNSDAKVVNSSTKHGSPKKNNSDIKKTSSELPNNNTDALNNIRKHPRITVEQKPLRNMSELPKNVEISDTLNLNSELTVIPLSTTNAGCVSLSACGETTTVFSTINRTMCSTKLESSVVQNCGDYGEARGVSGGCESKKLFMETEKEPIKNSNLKENKNLKRKHEEDVKNPEVPQKLPKPTILNHSIGLMNLSNNHPLKKHSKINRNGEHLLRTTELNEKVPVSTQNLTVNHVSVPQRSISVDTIPSKPIIINKNVSNLQITRPGTPKSGQRGGQAGNVPCYANKTLYNSVGGVNKAGEKNGDKVEGMQGKMEVSTPAVNSTIKPSISHSMHHTQSYHTPIITPSQLSHHQNLNSLQLKPSVMSNQEKSDQRSSQTNFTSQCSIVMSQAASQVHTVTSQSKPSLATSQTILSSAHSPIHPSSKASQAAPHSTPSNHQSHANTSSSAPSTIQTAPPTQTQPAIKTKPSTPIGYKTLRDPPKSWNSQINSQIARVNQNVKAQQLANAAAAAASQAGGVNAQGGRFVGDLKSVRPAKFFKGRNMPRYLGCPASGVKPMYQLQGSSDKEKGQEQQTTVQTLKPEKSEIKKHSIVKIDPKTLRPISEEAPETSNLSTPSTLGLSVGQNSQELRINSSTGDLKINTSSVSIFNPLKLQSSPKSERKSPKSPHSPKVKNSPNSSLPSSTNTTTISSSPSHTLSPKQHRDKTSLTFTPPNPFVPNLTSPTLSPNQFLYPAGGFPNYDPRFMAAYHSLLYSQRMAAAGFVAPPMPHPFGMNMGLNTTTTTMAQQQLSPRISLKHSTSPKSMGQQVSPRSANATSTQISKSSPTPPPTNKKTKESSSSAKIDKSLETALNKLSQGKAKEVGGTKQAGGVKQVGGNSKKKDVGVVQRAGVSTPLVDNHLGLTFMGGNSFLPPPAKEVGGAGTISALEKLSQNKAIEIMGGGGGKRSPAATEKDGRNSPMGGHKRDVGGSKGSPGRGRASPRLQMTETSIKNDTLRQQSPLTIDSKKPTSQLSSQPSDPSHPSQAPNQPSDPSQAPNQPSDPSKNSEKASSSNQSRLPPLEKSEEKKLHENKTITQNCSSSEPNTVSSELQTRLGPPLEAEADQKSSNKAEVSQDQSKIGRDQKEEDKKGSDQDQNGLSKGQSDHSQNRLDQNENMSDKSQSGSEISRKIEVDGSSCTDDSQKVHPSDKTVSVGEILDNSDIKATDSQISGKKTNTDDAVTDKSVDCAADNAVNVVSGETTTTTTGNAAKSDVSVTVGAGNVAAEKSREVGEENDKGGGEKKE